jgi:hypothetical protein
MSHAEGEGASREAAQVAAFLRALARRVERDPGFAAALQASLEESGLLALAAAEQAEIGKRGARRTPVRVSAVADEARPTAMDPFALWRAQGEEALRNALAELDLAGLRAVIRAHRLDPARVSSRWTARDRVAALIVTQVKARMNHGRAFERV